MSNIKVYYSYDFENESEIADQIMDSNSVLFDEPLSQEDWEKVKLGGSYSIKKWINSRMLYCSCLIVLIGERTSEKPIINYEIKKAWKDNLGVLGIYVSSFNRQEYDSSKIIINPFEKFSFCGVAFSDIVKCYEPIKETPYSDIKFNLHNWIKEALEIREKYMCEYV